MSSPGRRAALPVLPLSASVVSRGHEAELERDGWTRRFVAAPPRLDEMVALYGSLGFDVRVEPLDAGELDDDCADCLTGEAPRIVYTRRQT